MKVAERTQGEGGGEEVKGSRVRRGRNDERAKFRSRKRDERRDRRADTRTQSSAKCKSGSHLLVLRSMDFFGNVRVKNELQMRD